MHFGSGTGVRPWNHAQDARATANCITNCSVESTGHHLDRAYNETNLPEVIFL